MNEKAAKLMKDARAALDAKYYDNGYSLFKEALEIYNTEDTTAADRCNEELESAQAKYKRCIYKPKQWPKEWNHLRLNTERR